MWEVPLVMSTLKKTAMGNPQPQVNTKKDCKLVTLNYNGMTSRYFEYGCIIELSGMEV